IVPVPFGEAAGPLGRTFRFLEIIDKALEEQVAVGGFFGELQTIFQLSASSPSKSLSQASRLTFGFVVCTIAGCAWSLARPIRLAVSTAASSLSAANTRNLVRSATGSNYTRPMLVMALKLLARVGLS